MIRARTKRLTDPLEDLAASLYLGSVIFLKSRRHQVDLSIRYKRMSKERAESQDCTVDLLG